MLVHPGPGLLVEGGHVRSPPGVQGRLVCRRRRRRPRRPPRLVRRRPGWRWRGRGRVCHTRTPPGRRPRRAGRPAWPLFGVVLAAVLDQVVHRVGVAGDEGLQGAARADRAQLAVIADEHQFRPGRLDVGGQAEPGRRRRSCRPRRRARRSVVEASRPWSSRQIRLANVRDSAQVGLPCPGCGPPGRRWRYRSPGSRTSRRRRPPPEAWSSCRRRPPPRRARLRAPRCRWPSTAVAAPRTGDRLETGFDGRHRPPPRRAQRRRGRRRGRVWRARLSAMAVSRARTEARRVGLLPGAGHADQRDHLGVGQRPVDQSFEQAGSWPYRWGARATMTSRRKNTFRRARSPSCPRISDSSWPGLLRVDRGRTGPRCGGGVDRCGQALDRPADVGQLGSPPAPPARASDAFVSLALRVVRAATARAW